MRTSTSKEQGGGSKRAMKQGIAVEKGGQDKLACSLHCSLFLASVCPNTSQSLLPSSRKQKRMKRHTEMFVTSQKSWPYIAVLMFVPLTTHLINSSLVSQITLLLAKKVMVIYLFFV